MFTNIGGKIKGLAKFVCWAGIIICVLAGFIMIITGSNMSKFSETGAQMTTSGVLLLLLGSIGSWLGSLALYGFGELIERVVSIDRKLSSAGLEAADPAETEQEESSSTGIQEEDAEDEEDVEEDFDEKAWIEEHEKPYAVEKTEISADGKCCVCGIQVDSAEMKTWENDTVSMHVCDDCRNQLKILADQWLSGRKRAKAAAEVGEMLAAGKVSQNAEPIIRALIAGK